MNRILAGLFSLSLLGWLTISVLSQPPEKGPPGQRQRGGFDKAGQEKGGPPGDGRGGRQGGPGFELGRVIPPPMRQMLELSEEQITQLDKLEKELKEKLNKLLTDDQKKQLANMRQRGPGGPGGGPDGPPDGGNRKQGPGKQGPGKDGGNRPPPPGKDRG